jgi:hypothetical protein
MGDGGAVIVESRGNGVALGLALAQHTAHLGFTESTLDQIVGF